MREKLIKFLGGYTQAEYNLLIAQHSAHCDGRIEAADKHVEVLREEVRRLTDLMLTRAGFIVEQNTKVQGDQPQPINKRQSWKQIQRDLENEDARKLSDQIERNWRNKPGAVPVGDGNDEARPEGDVKQVG